MNGATLGNAMFNSLPASRYAALAPHADAALRHANCTSVNRAAMFLAQIGHESVGLKYTEEIASGSAYEGRPDLGNTQPGDGVRFKGRSFIQVTGRHNYTQLSAWAHAKGHVPDPRYFVQHPAALAEDRYAFLGAVWYWVVARNMNNYADARDIVGATRAVNGGLNGLEDRTKRWNRCLSLGTAILPGKEEEPLTPQDVKNIEKMIANAFRAYHQGGTYGRWNPKRFGGWIKDKNNGMGDRVSRLEKKIK